MHKRKVIFRADGNSTIGLGHVVRCCALADMLREDFDCYFSIRNPSSSVVEDILKYCLDVEKLDGSISYSEEAKLWSKHLHGNEIVVLDGYEFDTSYQQAIKVKGCKLVCIDDIHSYHFVADVVINHSPGISIEDYSIESHTTLLLGTNYVLLKKPYLCFAAKKFSSLKKNTNGPLLICFGGADPENITLKTLKQIKRLRKYTEINIVTGGAYQCGKELKNYIQENNKIKWHNAVNTSVMMDIMKNCPVAILSASTISLEYICIKGFLYLKKTAENQDSLYYSLIEKNCAYPYEAIFKEDINPNLIKNQSTLIDGKSGERLQQIFLDLFIS